MKLFLFNKEFDEEEYIPQKPTYVVAENYEKAVQAYNKGPNNNKEIWSVKSIGNPLIVSEEILNESNRR